jgi:trk system potassium uptake protein TrkA
VVCIYRDNDFLLPKDDERLERGDEVVLITHEKHLAELAERWAPPRGI